MSDLTHEKKIIFRNNFWNGQVYATLWQPAARQNDGFNEDYGIMELPISDFSKIKNKIENRTALFYSCH